MNYELRKFVAPEILMGTDVRLLAGNYFTNLGIQKILLVTDRKIRKYPWFESIQDQLYKENIEVEIFDLITPNSPHTEVMEGVDLFKDSLCEGILAIGGGSVMDSAKGIGIVYSNPGNILDYEGVDKVQYPTPPIVCIPTTSGTASDVSQFSIIRNMDMNYKIAIISKSLVPDLSLLDPLVNTSMDSYLTACTGLDALTHAIEAFVSTGSCTVTDFHALNAINLIKENLPLAISEPQNIQYRYNMMIASLEAGLAFSNASLGAVHAIAHSLGGFYNIAHGECNAILLNHVMSINYESTPEKFDKIGSIFGLDLKAASTKEKNKLLFNAIQDFKTNANITNTLGDLKVRSDDFKHLVEFAISDPCLFTNPRDLNKDDIKIIINEAL